MSDQLAPTQSTAQLFRSVRAARAWVLSGVAKLEGSPVAGCVALKPGSGGPPVFMLPGAAGSILQIAPLAAAMTVPAPVYAIKPRGLAQGEVPCENLAEMAAYAIDVMTKMQPEGPYLLIGYSAGGLVALEMARRLVADGREVPLVVLLDTYPSRETWPFWCHAEIIARQAFRALWTLRRLTPRQAADDVVRRLRSLLLYLTASGLKVVTPPPLVAEGSDAASRRVHMATYNAGEAYRPLPYTGRVVFVQPEFVPNLEPRAPRGVWGQFLADLVIRRVPGSHLGMLDEGAAAVAAEISRCLDEVQRW
ncbi:MAG TPA: alpha/beta fold hydrolase [Stellaceae bacterium]|jgi:acetoacetyl-CoA synthetase|nr:alpha/beta fold hydrolase [Stellaceae bacterium]